MDSETWTARHLAEIFISTDWTPQAMEKAALESLDTKKPRKWLRKLISEIHEKARTPYAPSPDNLCRLIAASKPFLGLRLNDRESDLIKRFVIPAQKFVPIPAFRGMGLPELASPAALAQWLNLTSRHLEWLADIEGYRASADAETTRHYINRWVPKRSGPPRLVEAPKLLLKCIQRKILREILDLLPAHACAHGFRKGRSCIGAAQLHAGEDIVITVDLKDFFPSIPIRRVHGLFRSVGYPWNVARHLTGLCSTATPAGTFESLHPENRHDWETRALFQQQHLPQGAPTSPALANLCARRLDRRLDGLAKRMGARYTRYGDDLAFSGDAEFARHTSGFLRAVAAICEDTGLSVNHRKTRIMGQGGRQRITGLVVNRHINIPRDGYDRLKATLYNCVRHGPVGQNRDDHPDFRAHLDGRITWVENVNLHRGHRLRLLFQRIDWS